VPLFDAVGDALPPDAVSTAGPLPLATVATDARKVVTLDDGAVVGTWHPTAADDGGQAVLMFNPGPNDRSSPHGLGHRVARALHAAGWPVLRFDPHGVGEAGGDDAARQDKITPEIHREINSGGLVPAGRAALAWLAARGYRNVLLTGLCGGGVNAVLTAAAERRPEPRLVVLGLPVLHLGTPEEIEVPKEVMQAEFTRMVNKALSPAHWWRMVSGKSDYRVLWNIVRARVARVFSTPENRATAAPAAAALPSNAIKPMIDALGALSKRGVRTTFVFSAFDPLYPMFRKHYMPGESLPAGMDLVLLEGANHALTDRSSEAALVAELRRVLDGALTAGAR
jgi:pimeloyl-ACP methyl ester carboxylesterase